MKDDSDFKKDLKTGLEGEKLLRLIAEAYVARGERATEVKNDRLVSESGNLYIERKSRGKASGIDDSDSPYWAIVFNGDKFKRDVIVIIKTERLREICQRSGFGDVPGGNSDTSRGYLISAENLVRPLDHKRKRKAKQKAKPSQQLSYLDTPAAPPEATATTAPLKAGSGLEQLQINWKQVLEQAPEDTRRTPAFAILRSAGVKPVAVENNTVVIAFRYSYHMEKIEEPENQQVAEKVISRFLGHPCRVRCIYEREDAHLLKAALKLGAQIIDKEEKGPP